jgi:hypothetical protein
MPVKDELLKCCYKWQTGNMKYGSWAVSIRGEVYQNYVGKHLVRQIGGI